MLEIFNHNKFIFGLEKAIDNLSFYWQSVSVVFCFILSFICYKVVRRFVFPKIIAKSLKANPEFNRLLSRYFLPLLYPLFSLLLLAVGLSIYAQFFKDVMLFSTTLKLVTLFLFLRFLRLSSKSNFVANAAGLFLMPALILDIFGVLESTIIYLDQYALKIGNLRISVYLIIKAFIVLLIVAWFANLIGRKSKHYIDSSKTIKSSTKTIITKLIDIIIYSVMGIIVLKTFGVDMTTFAVIGGAIGVGIGFGLQKIASNFISGIILLFEKSVEVGDCVELDNGNIFGIIKHFSGRYTLIEGVDGKEIMVPNEEFIVNKVTNWTYSNNRARVEIEFGVDYSSDLELVRNIAIDCAAQHPRCLDYPEIECYIKNFGESDIKFLLYFWISDITQGRAIPRGEVLFEIWKKFKANDIKIPYPQRQVRVDKNAGLVGDVS